MKSGEKNILKNGNIGKPGRSGELNKRTRIMKIIGEENYEQICKKHTETALYSEDEDQRSTAQRFFMSLVEPKPAPLPHETFVENISLSPMRTPEDIKNNEDLVLKKVCDGDISMEIGERFFALIEQGRKTWECTEGVKLHEEMKQMLEDAKAMKDL